MSSGTAVRRILMTTDAVGGVWTYAIDLCRALRAHGVEVVLATMGPLPRSDQRQEVAALENVALVESSHRLEWMDNPWDDVARAGEWLLDLERSFRPDAIHLNGYAHGALPWRAPVLIAAHSCVLSWWRAVRGGSPPTEWNRYRDAVRDGLHGAHLVVAPTRAMLNALQAHYGLLARTVVIPNGRNVPALPRVAKEPFVLSVGRLWDEAKNAATLARAARGLPWPVRLAGSTHAPGNDEQHFEGVELLGTLPAAELWQHFARASIYALPARYEPFGLSVLEAASAGCALVLGDIPSLREVWGEAALYVPPDDVGQLQHTLRELITDTDRRHVLAQRALQSAARYTISRMAERYVAAYAQLSRSSPVHGTVAGILA
ncbi:MAG: glycosyltransferase family 4 protein [Opitutus sp.]|nr:glycosyltransferase family 4 protein [Opitutus sp.]